jgi:uncharacterized protein YkwD
LLKTSVRPPFVNGSFYVNKIKLKMKIFTYGWLLLMAAFSACQDSELVGPNDEILRENRTRRRSIAQPTIIVSGATSTTPTSPTITPTPAPTAPTTTTTTLTALTGNVLSPSNLLNLINTTRSKGCLCGTTNMPAVPALKWNAALEKASFDHSKDMLAKNYFGHISPTNTYPWDRALAAGYQYSVLAENIAVGVLNESDLVKAWLASEGHCKNLMHASMVDLGIGRADTHWTALLGKPL